MYRLRAALIVLLCLCLFFVAHRGSSRSYFNDDDIDNLRWTRDSPWPVFLKGLADPRLSASNFRPVGHAVYKVLGATAGMEFRAALAVLQGLHLVNVGLLWLVARRLKLTRTEAGFACVFFAFHMAAFDACWKPMFLFDVLAAAWTLLALWLYLGGRWAWALAPFWLAYKTKEIAIGLPAVLGLYEWWLGGRRWARVAPFAAVSLNFGVQALVRRPAEPNDYSLQFTLAAFWECLRFYAGKILLIPWAGFGLPAVAVASRWPVVRFALAAIPFCLGPLLFLPGRKFAVYLYLALALLALAVGYLAGRVRPAYAAALFVPWLIFNFLTLRVERKSALAVAHENRAYVTQLAALRPSHAAATTLIYDGTPTSMASWGVVSALRWYWPGARIHVLPVEEARASSVPAGEPVLLVSWDRGRHKMTAFAREAGGADVSYLTMNEATPVWQLLEGWFPRENAYRWTRPVARARLARPAGAAYFELVVNVSPGQIAMGHRGRTEVRVQGRPLGITEFAEAGFVTHRFPLPGGLPDTVEVEIRVDPPLRTPNDGRVLGLAVAGFGFR